MTVISQKLAAIDVGTTKIVALIGQKTKENRFEIIGYGITPSKGLRRGVVFNIDDTYKSIEMAVKAATKTSGLEFPNEVFVGIAGQHVLSHNASTHLKLQSNDNVINTSHLNDLDALMKQLILDPGEEVIDIMPQSYVVDKKMGIDNPCGMTGNLLQANYHVVVAKVDMLANLKKCVTLAKLSLKSFFLEPVASSKAVLTADEKQKGVALLDIGGGTTDLIIYQKGKIVHVAVIPIGGNAITRDIHEKFSINENQAEELKINYGSALKDSKQKEIKIKIEVSEAKEAKEFTLYDLSEIIEARMVEILQAVMFQIENAGVQDSLAEGIVITGGGSLLKNLKQLTTYIAKHDIRIAYPSEYIVGKFADVLNNPKYSTAIGLLMKADEYETEHYVPDTITDAINVVNEPIVEQEVKTHEDTTKQNKPKFISILKNKLSNFLEDENG